MKIFQVLSTAALILATSAGSLLGQEPSPPCPTPAKNEERPWLNTKYTPECRASFVLQTFRTVDDKFKFISVLDRVGQGNPQMLANLGLSSWGWTDGPAGINNGKGVTAFPTPITMAANFDPAAGAKYGELLGQEVFDSGFGSVGGPAMDISRTWHFGRTTESFGEDPYLLASTVGPEVRALQSNHVIATLKHYAVYTQEQGRAGLQPIGSEPGVNEVVSERAIREIYLPGFRAAVVNGGGVSVMCSFATINDVPACQNSYLFKVLKKEWGFDGNVMPDFPNAQRSIIPSFLAGMDWGVIQAASKEAMSVRPSFAGHKSLRDGVQDGQVPMSRIDDMIMRLLVPGFRIGTFDYPAKKKAEDISTPERRAALVDIITGGAVLLKNSGNVLPLRSDAKTVAIIGAQATEKAMVVEQGSPYVKPTHLVPVLQAVQERAGQTTKVLFAQGTLGLDELPSIPAAMLRTPSGEPGVLSEFFANTTMNFSGKPFGTQTEGAFAIRKNPEVKGLPKNMQYSVRYTAQFTPDKSGVQNFSLALSGTGRLFIEGKLMGKIDRADFADTIFANVPTTAGKPIELRVEYTPREVMIPFAYPINGATLGVYFNLGWAEPDNLIEQAVEAARKADVAVVFVGAQVGEGMDRESLSLPNDQNALIEAVAEANPHTVVVLNIGGAVSMPWLDKVAGVLQMWLPGDSDGPATARLLFGDAEPGGRLPITFPKDATQGPGVKQSEYPGSVNANGALANVDLDEGIFVGYRYWDQYRQAPLFPFGYGLSYSNFVMKGLGVKTDGDGNATVDVSVRNRGDRVGSEVVQVYLGFPPGVGEPPKQLKGYKKVHLKPGEETRVQVKLDPNAFQYWSEKTHAWSVAEGKFSIMVGRSSREIVYNSSLAMPARGR
ncbi:MAG: glycoside hydrolase family 3 C-terminal domain-containing protein [Bryobacteraceae bacterium]